MLDDLEVEGKQWQMEKILGRLGGNFASLRFFNGRFQLGGQNSGKYAICPLFFLNIVHEAKYVTRYSFTFLVSFLQKCRPRKFCKCNQR